MPTPLVLIMGPTASGKSALAVALAQQHGGEIINADAMAVYRDMDIGTAKPSTDEQAGIPHHCLDCIDCSDHCDLQRWLSMAEAAVADIHSRGRLAIVSGGSPLYTKALLEGLSAGPPRDDQVRADLHARYAEVGGEQLLAELQVVDPEYASQRHPNDERRIVRALEVFKIAGKPYSSFHVTDGHRRSDYRTLLIGLRWDKAALHMRINARAKAMFGNGLIDEVRNLAPKLSSEARQAVGYKEVIALLEGACDQEKALEMVKRQSRLLAKNQMTWYRRFHDMQWLPGDADDLINQASALVNEFLGSAASS